jgi:hypothetical protein
VPLTAYDERLAALPIEDPLALVEGARQEHRLVHAEHPLIG